MKQLAAELSLDSQPKCRRGTPQYLYCGNGSEFTSQVVDFWAHRNQVRIDYFRPGKPTENAFIESFNGTFRRDCLSAQLFTSLQEAKHLIEAWRQDYNDRRPHRTLNRRTSNEFACQIASPRDLAGTVPTGDSF